MEKQERIVCAAMFVKWKYKDLDFKNEEVICGVNHNLIRKSSHFMNRRYNYDREYFSFEKGFITNKNRFVDAKEAMSIAIKSGQYPDYEFRKKVCLHEIEEANENKKHNQENIGFDGQLYVTDIGYLENKIKEYDSILERDYLKPEDLY